MPLTRPRWPHPCPRALRAIAQSFARGATDLVFPPGCAICGADLLSQSPDAKLANGQLATTSEAQICAACRQSLLRPAGPTCLRCAARISQATADAVGQPGCAACRDDRFQFSSAVALGGYDGLLREAVLRTKHAHSDPVAVALGELLWEKCGDRLTDWGPNVVSGVPMHWSRRLVRGTNSPDLLGDVLASRLQVPAAAHLLVRRINGPKQAELAPSQRKRNMRRAFRARTRFAFRYKLTGARVLLVDDVLTTGATASAAAAALRRAGAAEVSVAVVARADGRT